MELPILMLATDQNRHDWLASALAVQSLDSEEWHSYWR